MTDVPQVHGWCDARVALGDTMDQAGPCWQNARNRAPIDALSASL